MRRAILAALLVAASRAPAGEPPPTRGQLLAEGESALAALDARRAEQAFDRAASMAHSADAELGLVRSYMQAGEYRRALAFVAHTAGAHRDEPGGAALYAWLLFLGGQRQPARRILGEASDHLPDDPLLREVRHQVDSENPKAERVLLNAPARFAPYGTWPEKGSVSASGWLFDTGLRALVPLRALRGSNAAWLRNGLGALARGTLEKRIDGLGVAVLRLDKPLPLGAATMIAPRDPFPGSVAFAIGYADTGSAAPGWPLLRVGFVGAAIGNGPQLQLDLDASRGLRGGPVFDRAGRFMGIALDAQRASGDRLVPVSQLAPLIGVRRGHTGPATDASPAPIAASTDAIYESALLDTLQVIALR